MSFRFYNLFFKQIFLVQKQDLQEAAFNIQHTNIVVDIHTIDVLTKNPLLHIA